MAFNSLRDFMALLEEQDQLVRVSEPVSTDLEMTEIQTRVIADGGPAILFENVRNEKGKKSSLPVLVNLFGTIDRISLALGTTPSGLRKIGEALAFLQKPQAPKSTKDIVRLAPLAKDLLSMRPKLKKTGPVHEIILTGKEINLDQLPIQTCWPGEPSPLITWPLVVTKDSGKRKKNYNLGIYRMQKVDKNKTLMRWLKHRGGAQHLQAWSEKKTKPMPVAAVIGADPATILAAVTPVPDTLSEYHFAGLLRKKRVELVNCKTIPLKVPAEAEIVLEGHVSLENYQDEGPYGDHTGYYNSVERFPVFTLSAITMRKKPIYLSTYTGRPPDEPSVLGEALNEIFVPLLQNQFPEIVDFWLPPEGCSYRIAVVSIKKTYPGQAIRIMMGIWSYLRQFVYTKFVIVVDEDINIRNWQDVIWAISTRMDPVRDVTLIGNTPIDYLDFASPQSGLGGKMGLDATNKIGSETSRMWGTKIKMNEDIIELVTKKWPKLGLPGLGHSIWNKK